MRSAHLVACVGALSLLIAGCSETPATPADTTAADQKTIRNTETAWAEDAASKDVDRMVRHYADDASLSLPDMPIVKGKDAIRAALKNLMEEKNGSLSFTTADVQVARSSDLAYAQGAYTLVVTNPKTKKPETETGKYVTVYKKQTDGSWKAVQDISNADASASVVVAKPTKIDSAEKPASRHRRRR